jgi:hypothetical protein
MLVCVVLARAQDQARGQGLVVQARTVTGTNPLIAAVRCGRDAGFSILRAISSRTGMDRSRLSYRR